MKTAFLKKMYLVGGPAIAMETIDREVEWFLPLGYWEGEYHALVNMVPQSSVECSRGEATYTPGAWDGEYGEIFLVSTPEGFFLLPGTQSRKTYLEIKSMFPLEEGEIGIVKHNVSHLYFYTETETEGHASRGDIVWGKTADEAWRCLSSNGVSLCRNYWYGDKYRNDGPPAIEDTCPLCGKVEVGCKCKKKPYTHK